MEKIPENIKPNPTALTCLLLKSRADSTSKRYLPEIGKFTKLGNAHNTQLSLPILISIAATYFYTRYEQEKSYTNLVIVHAALKFIPYGVAKPLDSPICRNILETAKRSKNTPVNKKKPVTPSIIRDIIGKYSHPQTDLKTSVYMQLRFCWFS